MGQVIRLEPVVQTISIERNLCLFKWQSLSLTRDVFLLVRLDVPDGFPRILRISFYSICVWWLAFIFTMAFFLSLVIFIGPEKLCFDLNLGNSSRLNFLAISSEWIFLFSSFCQVNNWLRRFPFLSLFFFCVINTISEAVSSCILTFWLFIVKVTNGYLFTSLVPYVELTKLRDLAGRAFLAAPLFFEEALPPLLHLASLWLFSTDIAEIISKRTITRKVQITTKPTRWWQFSFLRLFEERRSSFLSHQKIGRKRRQITNRRPRTQGHKCFGFYF